MMGLLFTYTMTYGGALAALFNPFIGLLVYVCLAILKPESMWPWSIPAGNFSRIVAIALLAGWALGGFGRWATGRGKAVVVALIGYFVWMVVSAIQAPEQPIAWGFVEHSAKIILPILVGITTINSVRQLKLLAWVILLSHAYPAFELNMAYLHGYNQLREEGFCGLDNNGYAVSLVACSALSAFLAWHSDRWWQKAVATASAAFIVHGVLLSFSRGGMLGLIVTGLTAFAIIPKGWKECLALLLAMIVIVPHIGPEVQARFATTFSQDEKRSDGRRLIFWGECWAAMLRHPVFGVGPDHMPIELGRSGYKVYESGVLVNREAHTLWLQIGAELGVPGVIFLISYYSICVIRLVPIARGRIPVTDPWLVYLARAVIPSLCGFAISSQFVSNEFLEVPYYLALLGAGILKVSTHHVPPNQDSSSQERQTEVELPPADLAWNNH